MTNKLVVIVNNLKVPKIKKILLYEMKFLVPNYSCLQNPWLGGYAPRSPFCLFSALNWIRWTPPSLPKKIPGYATVRGKAIYIQGTSLLLSCLWKLWGPLVSGVPVLCIKLIMTVFRLITPFTAWPRTSIPSALSLQSRFSNRSATDLQDKIAIKLAGILSIFLYLVVIWH